MNADFDPYYRWLGIPTKDRPIDFYRLLGVERFEEDVEVIRDAAERQMAHVRTYQLGEHARLSQEVLNQLARAKNCLLSPARKTEYDRRLHGRMVAPMEAGPIDKQAESKTPFTPAGDESRRGVSKRGETHAHMTVAAFDVVRRRRHLVIAAALIGLASIVGAALVASRSSDSTPAPVTDVPSSEPTRIASGESAVPSVPLLLKHLSFEVDEGTTLVVQAADAAAVRSSHPLGYDVSGNVPHGMGIERATGQLAWTPTESQGPGEYTVTVQAVDPTGNATVWRREIHVSVREVNARPSIATVARQEFEPGTLVRVAVMAADADIPANELSWSLLGGPAGAEINSHGVVSWLSPSVTSDRSIVLKIRVSDNGTPPQIAERIVPLANRQGAKRSEAPSTAQAAADQLIVPASSPATPAVSQPSDDHELLATFTSLWAELATILEQSRQNKLLITDLQRDLRTAADKVTEYERSGVALQNRIGYLNNLLQSARNAPQHGATYTEAEYERALKIRLWTQERDRLVAQLKEGMPIYEGAVAERDGLKQQANDAARQRKVLAEQAEAWEKTWFRLVDPMNRLGRDHHREATRGLAKLPLHDGVAWAQQLTSGFAELNLAHDEAAEKEFLEVIHRSEQTKTGLSPAADQRIRAMALAGQGRVLLLRSEERRGNSLLKQAIRTDKTWPYPYVFRGEYYAGTGDYQRALADFSRVVRLTPDEPLGYQLRAWLRATCAQDRYRNAEQALEDALKARSLAEASDWQCLRVLAAAYAEGGEFSKAVEFCRSAIELAPASARSVLATEVAAYEAKSPWRVAARAAASDAKAVAPVDNGRRGHEGAARRSAESAANPASAPRPQHVPESAWHPATAAGL